jgi:hypothetical protein
VAEELRLGVVQGGPLCREFKEGRHKYCAEAAQADHIVTGNKRISRTHLMA